MSHNIKNSSKSLYTRSSNNYRCIGPCYPARTKIVHPTTMNSITNMNNDFCPVSEWTITTNKNGEKNTEFIEQDVCVNPINAEDVNKYQETNVYTLVVNFNEKNFLKHLYNIDTMDSVIEWLNVNIDEPLTTKIRIIDCAFSVFDIYFIDDIIIDCISKYLIKYFAYELYYNIYTYIHIGDDLFVRYVYPPQNNPSRTTNLHSADKIVIVTKHLIASFFNHDFVKNTITDYINKEKENMNDNESHIDSIKDKYIIDVKNFILNSLRKQ